MLARICALLWNVSQRASHVPRECAPFLAYFADCGCFFFIISASSLLPTMVLVSFSTSQFFIFCPTHLSPPSTDIFFSPRLTLRVTFRPPSSSSWWAKHCLPIKTRRRFGPTTTCGSRTWLSTRFTTSRCVRVVANVNDKKRLKTCVSMRQKTQACALLFCRCPHVFALFRMCSSGYRACMPFVGVFSSMNYP